MLKRETKKIETNREGKQEENHGWGSNLFLFFYVCVDETGKMLGNSMLKREEGKKMNNERNNEENQGWGKILT